MGDHTDVGRPADYRFSDDGKLGLPVLAVSLVVAVFWVPVIWRF